MTFDLKNLDPIRIGISACLLGDKVRYDGGHKEDRYITRTLGRFFQWVPVCPEVELGLGTPRETMRLLRVGGGIGLFMSESGRDLTEPMRTFARGRVAAFEEENLGGYILKSDSPSCGMERVRIHSDKGTPERTGRGLFAEALMARFPDIPIEEEGRLSDPRIRESWIERVFAYHRLKRLWKERWAVHQLVAFHTAHKMALLAHSPKAYQDLGRLVARAKEMPRAELRSAYQREFMRALKIVATRGRHANVLQHAAGYMKRQLDDASKAELHAHIEDYRRGLLPLIVPMTLINHYARRLDFPYLKGQIYLKPHPKELALRNHV